MTQYFYVILRQLPYRVSEKFLEDFYDSRRFLKNFYASDTDISGNGNTSYYPGPLIIHLQFYFALYANNEEKKKRVQRL